MHRAMGLSRPAAPSRGGGAEPRSRCRMRGEVGEREGGGSTRAAPREPAAATGEAAERETFRMSGMGERLSRKTTGMITQVSSKLGAKGVGALGCKGGGIKVSTTLQKWKGPVMARDGTGQ